MKTSILSLAVILTCSVFSYSQISEQWASRYSYTTGTDKPNSMAVDGSGNVYVTGLSVSGGFGTEDYLTIKYNSAGVMQWSRRYNGPASGSDIANTIAVDVAGYIYVTGASAAASGYKDYLTIKYNSAGDTLWTARYNGSKNREDIAYSVAVDAAGNVYVTGSSEGLIGTHGIFEDYVTVKYSSSGEQLWASSYNGPGGDFDAAYSVAVDGSGNVYVTGESGGGSGGSGLPYQDYATVKYNSAGIFQWASRYNGTLSGADDKANQLKLDVSGNVYVTGKSQGTTSSYDYLTIKYNSAGTLQWSARYNGAGNGSDEATSLDVDRSGNVFVTGISYSGSSNGNDIVTVKYNSLGVFQWANSYNGPANGDDGGRSIQVDSASNVYVAGYSTGISTGYDFATIKYNTGGTLVWSIRYSNGGAAGSSDDPACLKVDEAGNVYVTGISALDYATVKYAAVTGIEPGSNVSPKNMELQQNYPNPFNPSTKIQFSIISAGSKGNVPVKLVIYDELGKTVQTLVDDNMKPGNYEVNVNSSNFTSGTYFYKLVTPESSISRKMILIK